MTMINTLTSEVCKACHGTGYLGENDELPCFDCPGPSLSSISSIPITPITPTSTTKKVRKKTATANTVVVTPRESLKTSYRMRRLRAHSFQSYILIDDNNNNINNDGKVVVQSSIGFHQQQQPHLPPLPPNTHHNHHHHEDGVEGDDEMDDEDVDHVSAFLAFQRKRRSLHSPTTLQAASSPANHHLPLTPTNLSSSAHRRRLSFPSSDPGSHSEVPSTPPSLDRSLSRSTVAVCATSSHALGDDKATSTTPHTNHTSNNSTSAVNPVAVTPPPPPTISDDNLPVNPHLTTSTSMENQNTTTTTSSSVSGSSPRSESRHNVSDDATSKKDRLIRSFASFSISGSDWETSSVPDPMSPALVPTSVTNNTSRQGVFAAAAVSPIPHPQPQPPLMIPLPPAASAHQPPLLAHPKPTRLVLTPRNNYLLNTLMGTPSPPPPTTSNVPRRCHSASTLKSHFHQQQQQRSPQKSTTPSSLPPPSTCSPVSSLASNSPTTTSQQHQRHRKQIYTPQSVGGGGIESPLTLSPCSSPPPPPSQTSAGHHRNPFTLTSATQHYLHTLSDSATSVTSGTKRNSVRTFSSSSRPGARAAS